MTSTAIQLRALIESPAVRSLARRDPVALLAHLIAQVLESAELGSGTSTRLAQLPLDQREDALYQGLRTQDRERAAQVADILLRIGPGLAQITAGDQHSVIVAAIEQALAGAGEPLARMAPALRAALQSADAASWDAVRALRHGQPGIQSSIYAGPEAIIERSGHQIQTGSGTVSATTRAERGARISDSPINIGTPDVPAQPSPRATPPAPAVAELELSLHTGSSGYLVDARLTRGSDDVELSGSPQHPAAAALDLESLRTQALDPLAYGRSLSAGLLADRGLRDFVVQALGVTQSIGQPLSLQIRIAASATELHALRWETLCHPTSGDPLATSQHIWISRTLGSADWTPITRPDRRSLRTLVIIAAPTNLSDFNLDPIDAAREADLARAAFGHQAMVIAGHAASLGRIGPALRGDYDLLYLVAHGQMRDAKAYLYLADDAGRTRVVPAEELIRRVRELSRRPALAVFTVCTSAGRGDAHAIASLGPQLVDAGIPAVVAAQGNLSMESAAAFNPLFLQRLQQHGQIDQAVAEARAAIRDRHDWWAPALLTRLGGRQL